MSRTYSVKEAYVTLQGEGAQTGRAAVFLRFAGCNLWSGREEDRAGAACTFCDTDFVGTDGPGGGKFTSAQALAAHVRALWDDERRDGGLPYVVCTGGEPLLQLDAALILALRQIGMQIGVETNGTIEAPAGIDWLCVSPKAGTQVVQTSGHELKLVYPQDGPSPVEYAALDFRHFFLQPMDGPDQAANIAASAAYCLRHPQWRLSLQTHKFIGLP